MAALLEAFFTHGEDPQCAGSEASAARASADVKPSVQTSQGQAAANEDSSSVLYVHGPEGAGQTSLLLQFGFTQAKAGKNVVLVMCGDAEAPQQSAASGIVPLTACATCCMPVQTGQDNETWRRIHIKYLRSSAELQQFLCSLHMMREKASVLLVDSFERFFAEHNDMGNVYQTLAYMLETREYMETSTGSGLTVVAGATNALLLRNRPLLRRWCRFLEVVPDAGENDVFVLREEVDVGPSVATSSSSPVPNVRYEFLAPVGHTSGAFRLLQVQEPSTRR